MPSSGGGPGAVTLEPGRPLTIRTRETPGMHCPRCQHENRPQAKFCEECAGPLTAASPTAQSDADLQGEVENLRRALSEALDQQTATGEILRVISSSPTDVQPVFDAIVKSAVRLCSAFIGDVYRFEVGPRASEAKRSAQSSPCRCSGKRPSSA